MQKFESCRSSQAVLSLCRIAAVAGERPLLFGAYGGRGPEWLEPKHFHDKVVPELRQIPGFVGAQLSRRLLHEKIEFLVPTRWQSIDAIREFGTTVRHYEATRAD